MMMFRDSSLGRKMHTLRRSCMTLLLWKVSLFIVCCGLSRGQAGGTGRSAVAPSTPEPTSPHSPMAGRRSMVAARCVGFIAVGSPRGDLWRKGTSGQSSGRPVVHRYSSGTGKVRFRRRLLLSAHEKAQILPLNNHLRTPFSDTS